MAGEALKNKPMVRFYEYTVLRLTMCTAESRLATARSRTSGKELLNDWDVDEGELPATPAELALPTATALLGPDFRAAFGGNSC